VELTRPAAITVTPFEGDTAAWNALVARDAAGTFCHLAEWRDVLGDGLGHECPYLVALGADGSYLGVLPLVRVRSALFGHYLVSQPFLNGGGPLGTPAVSSRLAGEVAELARRSGADLLELRTRATVTTDLALSHRKITVMLDLPGSADALWRDAFPAKLRSQIRRPQKAGMEARFGDDQLEPFYDVFARTMRDLGTPVLPRRFFERIVAAFAPLIACGVVYAGSRPVAGGLGFVWRDEFEMTWAGSLREYASQAPNMLLYWAFLERMIERGLKRFDFGRCTPGGATHRFKRQWGGVDVPLPWLQWSARGLAGTPSPERPAFRLARAAWRRLPLPVANRLGPVLARQLP